MSFNIHFEVLVTSEPTFLPGTQDPQDLPADSGITVCTVVQVLEETEDSLVCCQSCRFIDSDMKSVSGTIVIPKDIITHRAPLMVVEDQELDFEDDDIDIPEGVGEDLYNLSDEERRYRGYD